ncbi:MAG: UPF0280 family protein [Candidatus Bathyarchaeota archaeon]|nr:UPF0280 family protein [Candidatus Bathyarchaeota archaeon]
MSINSAKPLARKRLSIKESVLTVIADKHEAVKVAEDTIAYHRGRLEAYIEKHADFLYALKPLEIVDGPHIVRLMAWASEKAGVGPMASVAGALADLAVEAMLLCGAKTAIVEDGGEVAAVSETPVDVALLAGNSPLSGKIGFRVEKFPAGIATSSGVYGHALSFGEAEAVTIFAKNASLADAAATAVCNVVRGKDPNQAIRRGVERALLIEGVDGVFIIYKGKVALAGEVPKLISLLERE